MSFAYIERKKAVDIGLHGMFLTINHQTFRTALNYRHTDSDRLVYGQSIIDVTHNGLITERMRSLSPKSC